MKKRAGKRRCDRRRRNASQWDGAAHHRCLGKVATRLEETWSCVASAPFFLDLGGWYFRFPAFRLPLVYFSHLTTHHPVINCQRCLACRAIAKTTAGPAADGLCYQAPRPPPCPPKLWRRRPVRQSFDEGGIFDMVRPPGGHLNSLGSRPTTWSLPPAPAPANNGELR